MSPTSDLTPIRRFRSRSASPIETVRSPAPVSGVVERRRRGAPACPRCAIEAPAGVRRCQRCGTQIPGQQQSSGTIEEAAPLVGGHRELSALTDLQVRLLVAALLGGDQDRPVCVLPSAGRELGRVRAGDLTLSGQLVVQSVEVLLSCGYLKRKNEAVLDLTSRGRQLAELALRSHRVPAEVRPENMPRQSSSL